MSYNSTYPLSQREKYFPNDSVDFVVNFAGKRIVGNSIAITGRLVAYKGGDPDAPQSLEVGDNVFYDGHVGMHGLFQTWTQSFNDRVIETFNHYPRYVKMKHTALVSAENSTAMALNAAQLMCFDQQQPDNAGEDTTCLTSRAVMVLPDVSTGRAFCIVPEVAVNSAVSVPSQEKAPNLAGISWGVSGEVKITVQLSSVNQFLYGEDVNNNDVEASYYLTDLELVYRTLNDVPCKSIAYTYKQSVKQIISSNNQALSFKTPIATKSMFASFILSSSENNVTKNFLQMDPLEGITRADWSINDLNQGVLEYPLEHYEEMKLNYLLAVMGIDPVAVEQMIEVSDLEAENKIRGIGLNYLEMLVNTKVALNILSNASNLNKYSIYIYFMGNSAFSQ